MRTLITPGQDTDLIQLEMTELTDGEHLDLTRETEVLVVVLSGRVDVHVDGEALGLAGGRTSVFEGPGDAVYAPPSAQVSLTAIGPGVELALASAPVAGGDQPGGDQPGPARIIRPADQRITDVGNGNWSRHVRTILGPEHAAARLLAGETINPPGNWSSYPPHKHDQNDPPDEVKLEEVYLFKVDPPGGFGVQIRYDVDGAGGAGGGDHEEIFTVRQNDVAAIKAGYHPVVGAPGYSLYYLWIMAGEGRQMIPRLDPRHAWVQQGA